MSAEQSPWAFWIAIVVSAWVVLTSAGLVNLSQDPWPYVLSIGVVVIAWTVRHFVRTSSESDSAGRADSKITQAIVLSGVILGAALSMELLTQLGWLHGTAGGLDARVRGVLGGIVVIAFSSGIPKQASTARGLAIRRVAGWALVVGGLGYSVAWLLAPLAYARSLAIAALLGGIAYALVRILWLLNSPRAS